MAFEIEDTEVNSAPLPTTEGVSSSVNISKENIIYRSYGTLDAKGVPEDKPAVRRQSADGKVWEDQEKAGKTRLCENTYTWYVLLDEAGFPDIVPDPEQRLAIINKGLNALQTAYANQAQVDFDKETGIFITNEQVIDLLDAINEPISKRSQSRLQKAIKDLQTLNEGDKAQAFAALMKMLEG